MRITPRFHLRTVTAVLASIAFSACGFVPRAPNDNFTNPAARLDGSWSMLQGQEAASSRSAPADFAWRQQRQADSQFSVDHPRVNDFVDTFQTRNRGFFQQALDRSGKYLPQMTKILEQEGLPAELAYLPIIESGFRNTAVSPAGACGPWQFIPGTGRRYGLRIDRYVDERRDPVKSTRAAAAYLRDLYGIFGDWHLSLAAYNTGEDRIARIMERQGVDSYWDMGDYLYPETRNYVPQFLAAVQIARAPEAHGFAGPLLERMHYEFVTVDRSLPLRAVAKMTGSSVEEIQDLNPALVRGVTPPDPTGYRVRVPKGTADQFAVAYEQMKHDARSLQALPELEETTVAQYRTRRGDTMASIAKRYGVSVGALMKVNGWKRPAGVKAGALVRIPDRQVATSVAADDRQPAKTTAKSAAAKSATAKNKVAPPTTYTVRKGDTPTSIAARLGIPVEVLMKTNGWKTAKAVRPGMQAKAPVPEQVRVASSKRK